MQRWISIAICLFIGVLLFALIVPATRQARESARRNQSRNNLKQIGLALYNYHDVHGTFPPGASVTESGQGLHGWFTRLLPFLASSSLYIQIDFDFPWDHPVNRHLISRQYLGGELNPNADFNCTKDGFAITHYSANPGLLFRNSGVKFSDIKGDLANCWMVGEAGGDFVPWGYPFNWRAWDGSVCVNSAGFGLKSEPGVQMLMADGHVQEFNRESFEQKFPAVDPGNPAASIEETAKPERRFELMNRKSWGRSLALAPDEKLGNANIFLDITSDSAGQDETVAIEGGLKQNQPRAVTYRDIETLVNECPNVRTVVAPIELDEASSRLLSQLRQLEVLRVNEVEELEPVLLNLKSFPRLRMLIVKKTATENLDALRANLPGIEVISSRGWF